MKELTIEEKAKRYDYALEIAKKALEHYEKPEYKDILPYVESDYKAMFPELAESEDEKVRKGLINGFKFYSDQECWGTEKFHLKIKDIIAWLEKQGKNNMGISEATKKELEDNLNNALKKETLESWNKFLYEHKPVDKIYPQFTFDDVLAIQHCIVIAKKVQEDKELYEALVSLHDRIHDVYHLQKEQKYVEPTDVRTWKYIADAVLTEWNGICQYLDNPQIETIAKKLQERFGTVEQKPVEFDEKDRKTIETAIKVCQGNGFSETAIYLKDLKDRCLHQPKKEWSEEDETGWTNTMTMIKEFAANHYTKDSIDLVINWLKSIKDRVGNFDGGYKVGFSAAKYNKWKPSDEQLKALDYATDLLNTYNTKEAAENGLILLELTQQLKTL